MLRVFLGALIVGCLACAAPTLPGAELTPLAIPVEGQPRTALAYFPEQTPPSGHPLVFIFHGHGGSAQ